VRWCCDENRWLRREGLGGQLLARDVGISRHGPFLDRKQRLAGFAIEGKDHSGLDELDHGGNRLAVPRDVRQDRRRTHIAIPHVVMKRLEVPDHLTGRTAQGDDRVGIAIVAGPVSAPEVGRRCSRGDEEQVPPAVGGHRHPVVAATHLDGRRLETGSRIPHQGIEAPAQGAGTRVKAANGAIDRGRTPELVPEGRHRDDAVDRRWRRRQLRDLHAIGGNVA
jgi:hypothetical protein